MTATTLDPKTARPGRPEGTVYRMTGDEFFRAIEAGVFPTERRIGLWEGQIYEKMAKKLAHAAVSEMARLALTNALPLGWSLWGENPILVDEYTAPLPDLTVIRGTAQDYFRRDAVPRAADIGLVIEMADTTLKKNVTETLEKYARAGLPVYWVLNLVDWRVEVYSAPVGDPARASYARADLYGFGQDVPLTLDGREVARIPVGDLLPVPNAPSP